MAKLCLGHIGKNIFNIGVLNRVMIIYQVIFSSTPTAALSTIPLPSNEFVSRAQTCASNRLAGPTFYIRRGNFYLYY
jgi:hypothetical protein